MRDLDRPPLYQQNTSHTGTSWRRARSHTRYTIVNKFTIHEYYRTRAPYINNIWGSVLECMGRQLPTCIEAHVCETDMEGTSSSVHDGMVSKVTVRNRDMVIVAVFFCFFI